MARVHYLLGLVLPALLTLGAAAGQNPSGTTGEATPGMENPSTPSMGTEQIQLRPAWRITESEAEQSGVPIGLIGDVSEDAEGHILLLDVERKSVRVHNAQGHLERTFGRPAEESGELTRPAQVEQLPDGRYAVLETFPGRLVVYKSDGSPAGTITPRIPDTAAGASISASRFQVAGGRLAIATGIRTVNEGKAVSVSQLGLYGLDGDQQSVLATHRHEMDLSGSKEIPEEDMIWLGDRWAADSAGTVFAAIGYRGYEITAFAGSPGAERKISRAYRSLKRDSLATGVAELHFRRFARSAPNITWRLSDVHKDIVTVVPRPNGELWVQPSDGSWNLEAGVLAEYDGFDAAGKYVRRVRLMGEGDPNKDAVFLLPNHVVVVHDFEGRARVMAGTADSTDNAKQGGEDAELITCYSL